MKWMLLTQEPTFFIFMDVTQEPTRRKCQLLLMYFTPWKHSLLKRHHQSKPSSDAKSSWEYPYTVAWGHATSSVGEYVETRKCHIFIHFIFLYSSHFIAPLTFYHTISIHICGFHLIISTLFIFSIISELWLNIRKLTCFSLISQSMDELCNV